MTAARCPRCPSPVEAHCHREFAYFPILITFEMFSVSTGKYTIASLASWCQSKLSRVQP